MQYFIFFDNFFKVKVDALVQDREYLKIQKILTKKFTQVKEAFSLGFFLGFVCEFGGEGIRGLWRIDCDLESFNDRKVKHGRCM
jgi:hypothetical protein